MATPNIPEDEILLSTEELVEWTGFSKQAFEGWRARRNGGPPYIKFSQKVRYRRGDVKAWIESQRVTPATAQ